MEKVYGCANTPEKGSKFCVEHQEGNQVADGMDLIPVEKEIIEETGCHKFFESRVLHTCGLLIAVRYNLPLFVQPTLTKQTLWQNCVSDGVDQCRILYCNLLLSVAI